MGFTRDTADLLWQLFFNCPEEYNPDFLDFNIWQVLSTADAIADLNSWRECMNRMEINQRIQQVIAQPEFNDVRLTVFYRFLARDSVTTG